MAKAPLPFPKRQTVAIVGGDSLLARELRELLEADKNTRVQLISAAAENSTQLVPEEEDAAVLLPLSEDSLEGTSVVYLAGSAASSRRALKLSGSKKSDRVLIDLTGSLGEQAKAQLRAPSAEPKAAKHEAAQVQVIAHPAAIALTMLLTRLAAAGKLRASLAHVFEPASERGQKGVEELRKQTVSVLSFKKIETAVFDTQLAFNVLARYGEEAVEPLEGVEARIERDTASLLSAWTATPVPSIRLLQAPVFHGHSMSLWVEFESDVDVKQIGRILTAADVDVRPDEPPSNANIAGVSGLSVGAIQVDRNHPNACWLWMVADNFRLAAENAVAVAKERS